MAMAREMAMAMAMEWRKWEELEMDCLVNIFVRLGLEDLILCVPLVCSSWYQASLNPLCWKILDLRNWLYFAYKYLKIYGWKQICFSKFLKFVVHRSRGSVRALLLPEVDVRDRDLLFISDECPNLKYLCLPRLGYSLHSPISEKDLPRLVGKWKDLEVLLIPGTPSSFVKILEVINCSCKNFKGLNMSGTMRTKDSYAIAKLLPKLRLLDLSWSTLKTKDLLVILSGCQDLKTLYVRNCKDLEVDGEIIRRTSHLKSFRYDHAQLDRIEVDYYDSDETISSRDLNGYYGSD